MGVTLLLTGIGHLGGPLLDRLAASRQVGRIVAVGRHAERGAARCNLARITAAAGGGTASVVHRVLDLSRSDRLADLLDECAPDVVVHTASLQTWWLTDLLPAEARAALRHAGYGMWLPLHLTLALRLMQAVEQAGYRGVVLNAAYPDVINVVLGRVGRAPDAGLGNVDELAAKVRLGVARDLQIEAAALDVRLVAHHALQRFAFAAREAAPQADTTSAPGDLPPFYLRVEHNGADVTEPGRAAAVLLEPCPLPTGPAWGGLSAAAAAAFIDALLRKGSSHGHAAGPAGLPGGYPVVVGDRRVTLRDTPGLEENGAIAVNERSHWFDGIETISEDGTVVFTAGAVAAMRDALGYHCEALPPSDAAARGEELAARFGRYAARFDVDLDTVGR